VQALRSGVLVMAAAPSIVCWDSSVHNGLVISAIAALIVCVPRRSAKPFELCGRIRADAYARACCIYLHHELANHIPPAHPPTENRTSRPPSRTHTNTHARTHAHAHSYVIGVPVFTLAVVVYYRRRDQLRHPEVSGNAPECAEALSGNAPERAEARSGNAPERAEALSGNAPERAEAQSGNAPECAEALSENSPERAEAEVGMRLSAPRP
jgi:hypothetical protein